jgi:TonB family protein
MTADWSSFVGDLVDGKFPLDRLLASGESSAVFRTAERAIKLVAAENPENLVDRWSQAAALDHPNLIGILKTGSWSKDGQPLAYIVTEFAEENLAEVLGERALTEQETLDLLPPAARALAYLHARGLAHGSLKPSNIFAVNDTLKLSRDTVSPGDSSADMRGLAEIVGLALTRGRSASALPSPFSELVRGCSATPPWSAAQVASWLESRAQPKASKRAAYAIAAAVAVVVIVAGGLWLGKRQLPAVPAAPPPVTPPAAESKPEAKPASPAELPIQVLPEIPAAARRTISGTATVVVRVTVDPSGEVTNATLEPGGSRYFGKLAVDAARKWRFPPDSPATPRKLSLRFGITREETTVSVTK